MAMLKKTVVKKAVAAARETNPKAGVSSLERKMFANAKAKAAARKAEFKRPTAAAKPKATPTPTAKAKPKLSQSEKDFLTGQKLKAKIMKKTGVYPNTAN